MRSKRRCVKTGCRHEAVATLTFSYADETAVLGPLSSQSEPHTYDLCLDHAERLTVPNGWKVMRLVSEFPQPQRTEDDWLALANAVREAGKGPAQRLLAGETPARPQTPRPVPPPAGTGRPHLRVVPNNPEDAE